MNMPVLLLTPDIDETGVEAEAAFAQLVVAMSKLRSLRHRYQFTLWQKHDLLAAARELEGIAG